MPSSHNVSLGDLCIQNYMCQKKRSYRKILSLNASSVVLICSMQSFCIIGYISKAWPYDKYMLQTFTYYKLPQAQERIMEVKSLTLFLKLVIFTLFTCLLRNSPRVPNYFELTVIIEINWHATLDVLFINAPSFSASMILQLVGISHL